MKLSKCSCQVNIYFFYIKVFSITQLSLLYILNKANILAGLGNIFQGENQKITFLNDYMMALVTLPHVNFSHETIFNYY